MYNYKNMRLLSCLASTDGISFLKEATWPSGYSVSQLKSGDPEFKSALTTNWIGSPLRVRLA